MSSPADARTSTRTSPAAPVHASAWRGAAGLVAIGLLACLQRAPVAGLGIVLPELHLGGGLNAVLTAAPALCIAVAALVLPALHTRVSTVRILAISAGMQVLGLALRALCGSTTMLLIGSMLAYLGVAAGGIALPVHIHAHYPRNAPRITATVAALISVGVATTTATTPSLLHTAHGYPAIAIALLLPLPVAFVAWILWARQKPSSSTAPVTRGAWRWMVRNPRTWALVVYFGLQSGLAIGLLSWEAVLFRRAGIPGEGAGLLVAVTMSISIGTALTLGARTNRARSQTPGLAAMTGAGIAGLLGLLLAPTSAPWLWAGFLGVGVSVLSVALALPNLRTNTSHDGMVLSSIVQGFGYLVAAAGPLALSLTTTATGITLLIAAGLAQLVLTVLVGRPQHITRPG